MEPAYKPMNPKVDPLAMDQADIAIEPLGPVLCEQCNHEAKFVVIASFRHAGISSRVGGKYCKKHAEALAKRIRAGLPKAPPFPLK